MHSEELSETADKACELLRVLANPKRLLILCHLADGEKSVSQLEHLLGERQAAVSQQLARLRAEGLVTCRRDGKARLYSVNDSRAAAVVELLCEIF